MFIIKVFKVKYNQVIVHSPHDIYDNYRIPSGANYGDGGYSISDRATYIPKRGTVAFRMRDDYDVSSYVNKLQRICEEDGNVELQYADLTSELEDVSLICFVNRYTGIKTYKWYRDSEKYMQLNTNSEVKISALQEGKLKIYNI